MALRIVLFAKPVLGVEKRRNALRDIVFSLQVAKNVARHVFELVGKNVSHVAQLFQSAEIVISCDNVAVTFGKCRCVRGRVERIN